MFANGTELAALQSGGLKSYGYTVPGGLIIGGADIPRRAVHVRGALRDGLPVWYLVAPDPFGQANKRGRAFQLSDEGKDTLYLAGSTSGSFRGRVSSRAWMEEVMVPGMLGEIERMAKGETSAKKRVTSAASSSKAAQYQVYYAGAAGDSGEEQPTPAIPWIPIAVVGAGVLLYLRR
jgi:hypothetical protein